MDFDFGDFAELFGLGGIDFSDDEGSSDDVSVDPIDDIDIDLDDAVGFDIDSDGIDDILIAAVDVDTDGDGIADSADYIAGIDTDGDGALEAFIEALDFGSDGTIDDLDISYNIYGDGDNDFFSIPVDIDDTDNTEDEFDGELDDLIETLGSSEEDEDDDILDGGLGDEAVSQPIFEDVDDTYENFDPENYDPESVVGDPASNMLNWHKQESENSCAVAAQEFVLEFLSGEEWDESGLALFGEENGWNTAEGTPMGNVGSIIEANGYRVERAYDNTFDDLEEALESGKGVIVSVDSDELWYGEDAFLPGDGADHAVQVIGIDYSNPDSPMVIINDSGIADGRGGMIPMADFMDAWADSDHYMVTAE